MKKLTFHDSETRSAGPVDESIENLKALFPESFTEGKIDFEVLQQLLGGSVEECEEKYGLNWHGKRQARQLALTPSTGTLRPRPEESVDWDTTRNLMIEGDNLEVLKLLQKSYAGKVKLIYIDPPYNTGKDFIYPDDYRDNIRNYLELTGQIDGEKRKLSSNTEASGRFHTDWLNMMYPRLKLARNLMRDDGVIFISIDENENANLRALCNEIFGEETFICEFIWKKKSGGGGDVGSVVIDHEYVLCYGRTTEPGLKNDPEAEVTTSYNKVDEDGRFYSLDRLDKQSLGYQESLDFPIEGPDGRSYRVIHKDPDHKVARWRWGKKMVNERYDELVFKWPHVYTKNYEKKAGAKPRSLLVDERFGRTRTGKTDLKAIFQVEVMDFPKPVRLMRHLLDIVVDSGDIALDFFAGSCPLGQAVFESLDSDAIRFILVQLPEPVSAESQNGRNSLSVGCKTVADIGKERLRRSARKVRNENPLFSGDLGFRVFKLDTSNIRAWEPDGDDLEGTLLDSIDRVKPDRSEEDILYELLLKLGLDLCVPIETRTIAGKTVRAIGSGRLTACLDGHITRAEVDPLGLGIAEWHARLSPENDSTVVFRDSAFEDDVAKTNLAAILEQHGMGNVRSL